MADQDSGWWISKYDGELNCWPTTIIPARYGGAYEGGQWLAFERKYEEIPEEVYGEDSECQNFFYSNKEPIGVGATPELALNDLETKLRNRGIRTQ